jgi:protein-tyrosine phosphatase
VTRVLDWDGGYNVRDLGGLATADGRTLRRGALVRSASPQWLTRSGWNALWEHGIRTVVDLRDAEEHVADSAERPEGLETVHAPLDDYDDREYWDELESGHLSGTPLYYPSFLDRFPARVAASVRAVAWARPGGVLVHCAIGRDRTGLVTLMLLAFAGVPPEDIAADHQLSTEHLPPLFEVLGIPDQGPLLADILARHGTTAAESLVATARGLDATEYLRAAGITEDDLAALRARLLE